MPWKIPWHGILFSGDRGSLSRVIGARAKFRYSEYKQFYFHVFYAYRLKKSNIIAYNEHLIYSYCPITD
jgi:hypothetical protein